MIDFRSLSEMEQDVLQEALTEYKVMLRTIKTPGDYIGKTLSEQAFLASDISAGRRRRYMATVALCESFPE